MLYIIETYNDYRTSWQLIAKLYIEYIRGVLSTLVRICVPFLKYTRANCTRVREEHTIFSVGTFHHSLPLAWYTLTSDSNTGVLKISSSCMTENCQHFHRRLNASGTIQFGTHGFCVHHRFYVRDVRAVVTLKRMQNRLCAWMQCQLRVSCVFRPKWGCAKTDRLLCWIYIPARAVWYPKICRNFPVGWWLEWWFNRIQKNQTALLPGQSIMKNPQFSLEMCKEICDRAVYIWTRSNSKPWIRTVVNCKRMLSFWYLCWR